MTFRLCGTELRKLLIFPLGFFVCFCLVAFDVVPQHMHIHDGNWERNEPTVGVKRDYNVWFVFSLSQIDSSEFHVLKWNVLYSCHIQQHLLLACGKCSANTATPTVHTTGNLFHGLVLLGFFFFIISSCFLAFFNERKKNKDTSNSHYEFLPCCLFWTYTDCLPLAVHWTIHLQTKPMLGVCKWRTC